MRALWLFACVLLCGVVAAVAAEDARVWQERPQWASVFEQAGVSGCALVYDESRDSWVVFDRARAQRAYSPASTFKLFNALTALESAAIKDEFEVIRWDGKDRDIASWNRDHSLASGMRFSVVWFYQELARRTGTQTMQRWIDRVGYGNRDLGGGIDQFWLDGGALRISAMQQIEFLRRLADGNLPFSAPVQETVRRISLADDEPGYSMHAKSGWARRGALDGKTDLGWYIGWVERDGRRWFFALNIDMPVATDATKRAAITRRLLVDIGALER